MSGETILCHPDRKVVGRILAGMIGKDIYTKYKDACRRKIRAAMDSFKRTVTRELKIFES